MVLVVVVEVVILVVVVVVAAAAAAAAVAVAVADRLKQLYRHILKYFLKTQHMHVEIVAYCSKAMIEGNVILILLGFLIAPPSMHTATDTFK